jgi:hypothetical protein
MTKVKKPVRKRDWTADNSGDWGDVKTEEGSALAVVDGGGWWAGSCACGWIKRSINWPIGVVSKQQACSAPPTVQVERLLSNQENDVTGQRSAESLPAQLVLLPGRVKPHSLSTVSSCSVGIT